MDNLVDLFQAVDASTMNQEVKAFIKRMIAIQFDEKPLAAMDKAIDESLGMMDQ
jgi:hypothetical protein